MPVRPSYSDPAPFPLDKADRCVKCGLCLPHCPTYTLTRNEAESPRGRIALMQGLAGGQLSPSATLQAHLDHCLGCRACEAVCPADVPYGELIDANRQQLQQLEPRRGRSLTWLAAWLTQAKGRYWLAGLLHLYQFSGLRWLLPRLLPANSKPARFLAYVPRLTRLPARQSYPASVPRPGNPGVQLFTGCVSELADRRVLQDSITLLQTCGFEASLPAGQGCCGALHQHNGLTTGAQAYFAHNLAAFGAGQQPIVGTATGCTAMLREYDVYADAPSATDFSARVTDINRFLLQNWRGDIRLAPLPANALVHDPCSLRNVLGGQNDVYELLRKIPQLDVQALPGNAHCCGAAGSMMLSQPTQADALLADKLTAIAATRPDYLITSNVGCAMHLAAGLRLRGIRVEVLHAVNLLARQQRLAA